MVKGMQFEGHVILDGPHRYQPRGSSMISIQNEDLILIHGEEYVI